MVKHPDLIIINCWQVIVWVLISAFWVLPMLIFWIEVWNSNNIFLLPCLFLFCMSISVITVLNLPERYYQPTSFELNGQLYNLLGVRFYKRWMVHGDYMNRLIRQFIPNYIAISRRSMYKFEAKTRANEREHLILLLVSVPVTAYTLFVNWYSLAIFLSFSNIVINFYPIILQRYNRLRIYKQLRRRALVRKEY